MKNFTQCAALIVAFSLSACGKDILFPAIRTQAAQENFTLQYEIDGPEGSVARFSAITGDIQTRLTKNVGFSRKETEFAVVTLSDLFEKNGEGAISVLSTLTPGADLYTDPEIPLEIFSLRSENRAILQIRSLNGKIWASGFDPDGEEHYAEIDPRIVIAREPIRQKLTFSAAETAGEQTRRIFTLFVNESEILSGQVMYRQQSPEIRVGVTRYDLKRFVGKVVPAQSASVQALSVTPE